MTNQHILLVPMDGHTEADIIETPEKSFVSWYTLLPDIKHKIVRKGDEEVVGLEVNDKGITVIIKHKNANGN